MSAAAAGVINKLFCVQLEQLKFAKSPEHSSIGAADSLTRGATPTPPSSSLRMTDGVRPETSAFIRPHYPPAADPDRPDFYRTVLDLVISFSKTNGWRCREGNKGGGGGYCLQPRGDYYL